MAPPKGYRHSDEMRKLISEKMRGKKKSAETRAKMSLAQKGRKLPEHSGEKHWNWNPDRDEQEAKSKSISIHRHVLRKTLYRKGLSKTGKTETMLGYSALDLRTHLEKYFENGMSWENYGLGPGKWTIDHIRPVSSFSLDTPMSIVNSLDNLRPMWWEENLRKSSKYEEACHRP